MLGAHPQGSGEGVRPRLGRGKCSVLCLTVFLPGGEPVAEGWLSLSTAPGFLTPPVSAFTFSWRMLLPLASLIPQCRGLQLPLPGPYPPRPPGPCVFRGRARVYVMWFGCLVPCPTAGEGVEAREVCTHTPDLPLSISVEVRWSL